MLGWFHRLLPREEKFFDLFERHSETVVAGAEALRALLDGGEAVPRHYQTIMDREQDADNITREVLITVRRTFITPFDRGDIKDLITAMDNAIDQMQKTAKGVMLFDQREFTPCMRQMGDAVVKCAKLVREAMPRLKSISTEATRLSAITEEIAALENKADDLHDSGLRELFLASVTGSAMTFITGNEVYDHLEKVVDRFDDVANRIHGIVIDHV
jgi:predicted phosphate transport protein (TIGR00153 family)